MYNSSQGRFENPRFGLTGNARCPNGDGQCFVEIFGEDYTSTPNYKIVDTDYVNYTVIYECGDEGDPDFAYLWFLARTPTVDQA